MIRLGGEESGPGLKFIWHTEPIDGLCWRYRFCVSAVFTVCIDTQHGIRWAPADDRSCQWYNTDPAPYGLGADEDQAYEDYAGDGADSPFNIAYVLFHFSTSLLFFRSLNCTYGSGNSQ